ncbi:hypothetical protein IAU60_005361 [Kwoniella sp. DSM 27419]
MANTTTNRVEMEKERVARKGKEVKAGFTPLKLYLLAYNVASALLWGHLLYITVSFLITPRTVASSPDTSSFFSRLFPSAASSSTTHKVLTQLNEHLKGSYGYKNLGWWTKYTQSLAVLEVVHAALGWVRSPLGTVMAQVASRVYTVWGVAEAVPEVSHSSPLYATMLLAWSLTEVIRYTFYALSILQVQSPLLNWLRYTTFIPLYPLGAGSEAFLSFSTLPAITPAVGQLISYLPSKAREAMIRTKLGRQVLWNLAKHNAKNVTGVAARQWGPTEWTRLVLFIGWWPALYVLFTYMLGQRRKVLGKGKTVGGVNKAR